MAFSKKATPGPRPGISTLNHDGGRVESHTVFTVDGIPTALEGEPPIAASKGWGSLIRLHIGN